MNKNDEIRQMQSLALEVIKEHIQYKPLNRNSNRDEKRLYLLKSFYQMLNDNNYIKFTIFNIREQKPYSKFPTSDEELRDIINNFDKKNITLFSDDDDLIYMNKIIGHLKDIITIT